MTKGARRELERMDLDAKKMKSKKMSDRRNFTISLIPGAERSPSPEKDHIPVKKNHRAIKMIEKQLNEAKRTKLPEDEPEIEDLGDDDEFEYETGKPGEVGKVKLLRAQSGYDAKSERPEEYRRGSGIKKARGSKIVKFEGVTGELVMSTDSEDLYPLPQHDISKLSWAETLMRVRAGLIGAREVQEMLLKRAQALGDKKAKSKLKKLTEIVPRDLNVSLDEYRIRDDDVFSMAEELNREIPYMEVHMPKGGLRHEKDASDTSIREFEEASGVFVDSDIVPGSPWRIR